MITMKEDMLKKNPQNVALLPLTSEYSSSSLKHFKL